MPNSNSIFERYEIKYKINVFQRHALEKVLCQHCKPDSHGESTVCSLYCDTPDFRLIRHSLEKPVYKEKLRLRSYGTVQPEQPVFLEMKKKYKDVVYKRRILVPEQKAMNWLNGRGTLPQGQISRELDYFKNFYPGLQPSMYLCSDRAAWYDLENPQLRITLDANIRWRTEALSLALPPAGLPLLEPETFLLEIKTDSAVPLWLVQILSELKLYKTSFSKYGTAWQMAQSQTAAHYQKEISHA